MHAIISAIIPAAIFFFYPEPMSRNLELLKNVIRDASSPWRLLEGLPQGEIPNRVGIEEQGMTKESIQLTPKVRMTGSTAKCLQQKSSSNVRKKEISTQRHLNPSRLLHNARMAVGSYKICQTSRPNTSGVVVPVPGDGDEFFELLRNEEDAAEGLGAVGGAAGGD
ncbi:hypothetical protein F5X96DRAFT_670538 [Biscogniauxia mediterranea]|nr:hypothetical protein F5X96DRAFT_670538 [Biscogniauxia mediterranea]